MPNLDDLHQFNANDDYSKKQGNQLEILIFSTEPSDEYLDKVSDSECIIFEFKMNGSWILYGCSTKINEKKEYHPAPFNKRVKSEDDIKFLDSIKSEPFSEDTRNRLLSIAETYGQTTVIKSHTPCPEKHTNLSQKIYKTTSMDTNNVDIYQSAQKLIKNYKEKTNLSQEIVNAIKMDVEKLLNMYFHERNSQYDETTNNIKNFLKFWIALIFKFANEIVKNQNNNYYTNDHISEIITLPLQTFMQYQAIQKNIPIEHFIDGNFALSVLLEGLLRESQLVTQFLRHYKNEYSILKVTQLNDYHKEKIAYAMTTPGALKSYHTMLFCTTIVELPLKDSSFIEEILQQNLREKNSKIVKKLLENITVETNTESSKNNKKPKNAKKSKKKTLYVPSYTSSEEKKLYTEHNNSLKEKNQLSGLNQIAIRSPTEARDIFFNYSFGIINDTLKNIKIFYDLIIEHNNSIIPKDISSIEYEIESLGNKFYRLSLSVIFILLKVFIIPIFNPTHNRVKTRFRQDADELLLKISSNNATIVNSILIEFTEDDKNNSKPHDKIIKQFASLSDYIEKIASINFNTFTKTPKTFTNTNIQLSNAQKIALNFIDLINKIFAMDDITYNDITEGYRLSHLEKTPFGVLKKFLRYIFDNNLDNYVPLDETLMVPLNEIKNFNKQIEDIDKIDAQLRSIKKLLTHSGQSKTFHRITADNLIRYKEQVAFYSRRIEEIRSQILSCQNIDVLTIMRNISEINKERLYKKCEKSMKINGAQALIEIFALSCKETNTAAKIEPLISKKPLCNTQHQRIDYNSLNDTHLKSLNTCLIALKKISKIQKKYDGYKFSEKITQAQQLYHNNKYNNFLETHKKWLEYKVNAYQEIKQSIKTLQKNNSDLEKKISVSKKNILVIDFDNDTHDLIKKIPSTKEQLESINALEIESKCLLEYAEKNFSEFKYQSRETVWNTKDLLGSKSSSTTLSACLKARANKIKQLAENANATMEDIDVSSMPSDSQLNELQSNLNNTLCIIKKQHSQIIHKKIQLSTSYDLLLELQNIHTKQTIELEQALEEYKNEEQQFLNLHKTFTTLFNIDSFNNDQEILPLLLRKIEIIDKQLKFSSYHNFIMTLRAKSQKLKVLSSWLLQIDSSLNVNLYTIHEEYEKQTNEWIGKIQIYLKMYINTLIDKSQHTLDALTKLNLIDTNDTSNTKSRLADLSKNIDSLKENYHLLLELAIFYKNYGIELFPEKKQLQIFYKSIINNQEIADLINNAILQKENHTIDDSASRTTFTEPSNELKNRTDSEKNEPSFNIYIEKNKYLAQEFYSLSYKVLNLEIDTKHSKNTIETLLPKVSLGQGRERFRILLENKIKNHADDIQSYIQKIKNLLKESATLVENALNELEPFIDPDSECININTITSMIRDPNCNHLTLTADTNKEYILSIENKSGSQSTFVIKLDDEPTTIINLLTAAVEGQNRLLENGWYVNKACFIIDSINNFLSQNNFEKSLSIIQKPSYIELHGSIMNIMSQAKKIMALHYSPCYAQSFFTHKLQKHNELRMILCELEAKLDLFIQYYYTDPLLTPHLEELNIAGFRTMLINLITEEEIALNSFQPISDFSFIPVVQNQSSFFANALTNGPDVMHSNLQSPPGMQ